MKDVKDYRERELPLFIIANVLIFLIVHLFIKIDINDLPGSVEVLSEVFISAVLSVVAFGFILVVECLFTSGFKEKLIYFFGILHLPGCTIFSDIKRENCDNRFSYEKLAEKYNEVYKNLPTDRTKRLRYENEQWYSIYSRHRDAQVIRTSQRDSLLCRDIYISTLVMIGMYIIVLVSKFVTFNCWYLIFLISMAIITNIGANRKAARFAYNVIAYDLNEPQKKESK